jgi:hypothetical protein
VSNPPQCARSIRKIFLDRIYEKPGSELQAALLRCQIL